MTAESTELLPADVFMARGDSLLSRLIRFCTQRIGESRTEVNHVGIVVAAGTLRTAVVVEALIKARRHSLNRYAGESTAVAVYRPINLTPAEIETVVEAALDYEGRTYGFLKLPAHFLDWLLQGAFVFRRLTRDDRYPICSWLVAYSFDKAGKNFGVRPVAATPDDIWDFVHNNPSKYREVRSLAPLQLAE